VKELDLILKKAYRCDSCLADFIVRDFNSVPNSIPYNMIIQAGFMDLHIQFNYPTGPVQ